MVQNMLLKNSPIVLRTFHASREGSPARRADESAFETQALKLSTELNIVHGSPRPAPSACPAAIATSFDRRSLLLVLGAPPASDARTRPQIVGCRTGAQVVAQRP